MVIERRETSVCTDPPGFDNDLVVTTEPVALMRVFSGIVTYPHALADGSLALTGPSHLTRALPTLVRLEPVRPGGAQTPGSRRLTSVGRSASTGQGEPSARMTAAMSRAQASPSRRKPRRS